MVLPGDILRADEAIEMIPEVDLGPPIEVPPIPAEADPKNISEEERQFLKSEIRNRKKEIDALLLAHNYEPPDVQDEADFIGDSIHLAKIGRDSKKKVIVEAAVLFMPEILAVMKQPDQIILTPSLKALCSLAAHADVNKILGWKHEHPNGKVISYVNTYMVFGLGSKLSTLVSSLFRLAAADLAVFIFVLFNCFFNLFMRYFYS